MKRRGILRSRILRNSFYGVNNFRYYFDIAYRGGMHGFRGIHKDRLTKNVKYVFLITKISISEPSARR